MENRMFNGLIETLYATFVVVFYYFMLASTVQLYPFVIRFSPPLDVTELGTVASIVFLGVVIFKSIGFIAHSTQHRNRRVIYYTPSERH